MQTNKAYIYIYTYIHTCMHTYIHTYIQTNKQTNKQRYMYGRPHVLLLAPPFFFSIPYGQNIFFVFLHKYLYGRPQVLFLTAFMFFAYKLASLSNIPHKWRAFGGLTPADTHTHTHTHTHTRTHAHTHTHTHKYTYICGHVHHKYTHICRHEALSARRIRSHRCPCVCV